MADEQPIELGEGAVAVVDALGFKAARIGDGAVARLVASVRSARRAVLSAAALHRAFGGAITHVAAFSDSVIVATMAGKSRRPGRFGDVSMEKAVDVVACAAAALMNAASGAPAPLAYRGCIGVGDLCVADQLFVGRAIDSAAEWYEAADAAIIWLTPAAERAIAPRNDDMGLFRWAVPLKGRGPLEALCVNPFYQIAIGSVPGGNLAERIANLETALLASFGSAPDVDVARKRQNTVAFLERAKAHTHANFKGLVDAFNYARMNDGEDDEDENSTGEE